MSATGAAREPSVNERVRAPLVVLALLLGVSTALSGEAAGVLAHSGDRLTSRIDDGDTDAYAVDVAEGGRLSVTVTGRAGLLPSLRLFRPDGSESFPAVSGAGRATVRLKRLTPGPGETGTWRVLVSGAPGTAGLSTASFSVGRPASASAKGLELPVAATRAVPFTGDSGDVVTIVVAERSGGTVGVARVLSPSGAEVPGSAAAFVRKGRKLTAAGFLLGQGFGRYRVELSGAAADVVTDVSVKVKFAAFERRTATLPEEASLAPASAAIVRQGTQATALSLHGTNFLAGSTARIGGSGVVVTGVDVIDAAHAVVTVSAADDAPFGPRDLVLCPPPLLGEPVAAQGLLVVHAPDPTLAATSVAVIRQGELGVLLEVTGTGLREGGNLATSATGIVFGATEVRSPTLARTTVSVAQDAPVGPIDVKYTQPAAGGAAEASIADALTIHHPTPLLTSLSPSTVTQGDTDVVLTLTGAHFRDLATVSLGAGVTVTASQCLSDTSFRVTVTAAADAAFGARSVTYSQPAAGGGAAATLANALQVNAPTPSVTVVSPTVLKQGQSAITLTVTGTNFRTGGALTVSGTGLTLGATSVVSATSATVTVSADADAAVGPRDVTFTQPALGGGASGTGAGLLAVHHPDPTITAVSPSVLERGTSGTFTIDGTGFRSGFALTTNGAGVSLSNPTLVSASRVTASFAVTASADLTSNSLTYVQPADGGGASTTRADAYSVLPPGPTLASVSPSPWRTGDAPFPVQITGTNFNAGTTVAASGTGVTISTVSATATTIAVRVTVASNATIGPRTLTITPAAGGGPGHSFPAAATIVPADPQVLAFSHASLAQGASAVAVTVDGAGFRSGDSLSADGTGVTFSSVTVVSASRLSAVATVGSGAATGLRGLTVTHPAAEGGRSGTLTAAFRVTSATPAVTSVNPAAIAVTASGGPTRDVPFRVTGTNFMSGASISVSKAAGSGVTVKAGTVAVVSDTLITATLTVTAAATTGAWDIVVSNPSSLGSSGSSGSGALQIRPSSTLTVQEVASLSESAYGGERVTVRGGGFAAGAVVDFGSERALATHVLDANTLLTTVPQPASLSRVAPTPVTVTVTLPGGASASLPGGYAYARDDLGFVVTNAYPPSNATGLPGNLTRTAVRLSAPCDVTTAPHGSTTGVNAYWYRVSSTAISASRSFGPMKRWLVLSRTTTTALASAYHFTSVPVALTSISGRPLRPINYGALDAKDQYSFSVTGATTDATAPVLVACSPADQSTGVDPGTSVQLVFSEEIDPLTLTGSSILLQQGGATVAAAISLAADQKTVTVSPYTELVVNASHTVTLTTAITDMCGNPLPAQTTVTFGTSASDSANPVVDRVVVERVPSDMDGSGTYVNASGTAGTAFDLYLPRSGFLIEVGYSDAGGSGIDESQFSAKCSAAVGSNAANSELASLFTVTPTGAVLRVASATPVAAGEDVTFTFVVKDRAGNASASKTITVDVVDRDSNATLGGDHDPFDARQTVVLRADIDAYTVTFSGSGSTSGATTSVGPDGTDDFSQALEFLGLNSPSMTTASAAAVSGIDVGTNRIMKRLVLERLRAIVLARFHVAEDGTHGPDSADIEILLAGEQGSLASPPAYATANSTGNSNPFSEISLGGTLGAETSATTSSSPYGAAWIDPRNRRQEANLNYGVTNQTTGVFTLSIFKRNRVGSSTGNWGGKVLGKFMAGNAGAVRVGEDASDATVLAGSFDRTSASNTAAENARYDAIMDGIDVVARFLSTTTAHEIGHSSGLVYVQAPKTGLFGSAHYLNTFTEATSVFPNTGSHLDYVGNDMMATGFQLESSLLTGTDFQRFSPLDVAYLRGRLCHDEAR